MTQEEFLNHRLSKRLSFNLVDNGKIQQYLSQIDGVNKAWEVAGSLSPQFLSKLETNTIVSSTGASTRIEGSKLSDDQVERFLRQKSIRKLVVQPQVDRNKSDLHLVTRDEQEVAGYLEMLSKIFQDYNEIELSELTIKQAHSILLKHSIKDDKHRGAYKTQSNQVVALESDGSIAGIIFDPSTPEETPREMKDLVEWTLEVLQNKLIHPLIIIANFVFEFLSIHPFKDGNGRISRILTNLLLLQNGYSFTRYISNERLIEKTKVEYYMALRKTTNTWKTDKEDLTPWLFYFLEILQKQADLALDLAKEEQFEQLLSEKQNQVWQVFLTNDTASRKELAEKTGLSVKTVEDTIRKLMDMKKLDRLGEGRATRYRVRKS